MVWGLTKVGFKAKDFDVIKNDLESDLKKEIDPQLRFGPDSVAGMITSIVAHQARQVWEAAHSLYHSLDPTSATGQALDALCALTGTHRKRASFSKAKVKVTLESNGTLAEGSRIETLGGNFFRTEKEYENESSAEAEIEAEFIAEQEGPIHAHEKTVAKIMTPTAAWKSAVIKETHEVGRFLETDEELRLRRIYELKAVGSSTRDAIQSRLIRITNVQAVHIIENEKSFEAVVQGGDEQEIAQTIWNCKPLGIFCEGKKKRMVMDSNNQSRIVRFSRPEKLDVSIYMKLKVSSTLLKDEENQIKNAIVDFSKKVFRLGAEIYLSRFYAVLLKQPKVLDVLDLKQTTPKRAIRPYQIASLPFDAITLTAIEETAE